MAIVFAVPPPPPPEPVLGPAFGRTRGAVPLPRKRGRIEARRFRFLPCEAGEGNHAEHGGGGGAEPNVKKVLD